MPGCATLIEELVQVFTIQKRRDEAPPQRGYKTQVRQLTSLAKEEPES
jgi:hypothetical protein